MKIVFKIGGSVIGCPPSAALLQDYANLAKRVAGSGNSIVVAVGGGVLARAVDNSSKIDRLK